MHSMRQMVVKLLRGAESMQSKISDLKLMLNEESRSGGLAPIVDPSKRFQQEQMLMEVELMRTQSQVDFRDSIDLLGKLIELTHPNELQPAGGAQTDGGLNAITEEDDEGLLGDILSNPAFSGKRDSIKQVLAEMVRDIREGGALNFTHVHDMESPITLALNCGETNAVAPGRVPRPQEQDPAQSPRGLEGGDGARTRELAGPSSLVAIARFDPPITHTTQMLTLVVGDVVDVQGQDGRGWWYGRKQDGTEGWFPPSYVQVRGSDAALPGSSAAKAAW